MNKIKKLIFILFVAVGIACYCYTQQIKPQAIFLENIEALANGEGGYHESCAASGNVNCSGIKVKYSGATR